MSNRLWFVLALAAVLVVFLGISWISGASGASVTLTWTAPRDLKFEGDTVSDSTRTVAAYDLRFDTAAIDSLSWPRATVVNMSSFKPGAPGHAETFTVTGLQFSRRYFFALKSRDAVLDSTGAPAYNWSPISNNAIKFTLDRVSPLRVFDLR